MVKIEWNCPRCGLTVSREDYGTLGYEQCPDCGLHLAYWHMNIVAQEK